MGMAAAMAAMLRTRFDFSHTEWQNGIKWNNQPPNNDTMNIIRMDKKWAQVRLRHARRLRHAESPIVVMSLLFGEYARC